VLRHSELRTAHRKAEVERQASYTGEDWPAGGSGRGKHSDGVLLRIFLLSRVFLILWLKNKNDISRFMRH
jgi:hypothetical protein